MTNKQRDHWNETAGTLKNMIAGGVAGAVSRTAVSPLERMKILFQVQGKGISGGNYSGVMSTLTRIGREDGWRGYFKGNWTNIVRIVPYSAVQFSTYELAKQVCKGFGRRELTTRDRLISGAFAGVASVVATYPLDLIRTRLSLNGNPDRSILACGMRVYSQEGGIIALYSGILPTVLGVAPYVALNFTVYETLRNFASARSDTGEPSVGLRLACGGAAGAIAQTCTYPLDVLRRRMQVSDQLGFGYRGTWDACQTILRREGVLAFYNGIVPNFLKVVPSISISFVSYELVKKFLS